MDVRSVLERSFPAAGATIAASGYRNHSIPEVTPLLTQKNFHCTIALYNERGGIMEAVTYSNFRQNLRRLMRQINDDAERLVVTTNDNTDVVVLSKADYDAWQETFYLMQSKLNRTRLDDAITDVENSLSNLKEFDFDEETK